MEILHEINLARFWKLFCRIKNIHHCMDCNCSLGLNDWLQHTPNLYV